MYIVHDLFKCKFKMYLLIHFNKICNLSSPTDTFAQYKINKIIKIRKQNVKKLFLYNIYFNVLLINN